MVVVSPGAPTLAFTPERVYAEAGPAIAPRARAMISIAIPDDFMIRAP